MSLKHVILAALSHQSATGYELAQSFDQSLGYFWQASHQQIYKDLAKLESQGDVSYEIVPQSGKPERKVYQITPQGLGSLQQWICEPGLPMPLRDSLLVKLYAGTQVSVKDLIGELHQQQNQHQQRLASYQTIESQYFPCPDTLDYPRRLIWLTLKQGLMYEEQRLKWFELALGELTKEIQSEPGSTKKPLRLRRPTNTNSPKP